jgi:hypothetical protein
LVGRPSAGGKAPLWQVEHWPVIDPCEPWAWLNLVGLQLLTAWQLKQLIVVGMCAAGLPVAVLPLWQVVQFVAAENVLWSTAAPVQTLVDLWQVSHAEVVWMWLDDLPVAGGKLPLWHVAHCAVTDTLVWNLAGAHAA